MFVEPEALFRDGTFASLGLASARRPDLITFAENHRYLREALKNPNLSCLVTTETMTHQIAENIGVAISEKPRDLFYAIHELSLSEDIFSSMGHRGVGCQVHPTATVGKNTFLGDGVSIGEFAVVRDGVTVGDDSRVEAGAKLGIDGILHRLKDSKRHLIKHGGTVEIGKGTVLMPNSTVARAVFSGEVTKIGDGCVIGINSVVGHDVQVGNRTVISNNCVLARGARVAESCFIGTGSFLREFLSLGLEARVLAGSIVVSDVAPQATVSGNFAVVHVGRIRHRQDGRAVLETGESSAD